MSRDLEKHVGQRIRKHRQAKGLSQEKLASLSGCHRTYVGMVERAEKSISVAALSKFAEGLGVSMSDLLEGL